MVVIVGKHGGRVVDGLRVVGEPRGHVEQGLDRTGGPLPTGVQPDVQQEVSSLGRI
jgi:hypothetical protein